MERWQQVGPSAVNTKLPFGSINIQKSIPVNPFCDLFYDDAEYIGFWNNKYVYRLL